MTNEEKKYNQSMMFFAISLLILLAIIVFTGCVPAYYKARCAFYETRIEALTKQSLRLDSLNKKEVQK